MAQEDRFLFINPIKIRPIVGPIAIDYLSNVLQQDGFKIDFIDNAFSLNLKESITEYLKQQSPLAIGITVRNTDDCYFQSQTFFIDEIKKLITYLKSINSSPIILGGVGFSIMPEAIMEYCNANFGVKGDGEEALLSFLNAIKNQEDLSKVPNLIYRKNGNLISNSIKFVDLNSIGTPKRQVINNFRYFEEGGQGNIETKRGCDQNCIYCADPISKGKKIRLKPPKNVIEEFKILLDQGVDIFHLCDSEFNIPESHARNICQEIIKAGINDKLKWYAYCSPKPFSEELGGMMKDAGCVGIDFGVDSGNDGMLKNLKRNFNVKDIRKTAEICKSLKITFMFDLLIGGPGETNESIKSTIELMKEIRPDRVGLSIGIRIYPKTELAEFILKQGSLEQNPNLFGFKENNSDFLKPIFYLSPEVGGESCFSYISKLVGKDPMFFFADPKEQDQNYNYNENIILVNAIKNGYRGAFWDILRRLSEK